MTLENGVVWPLPVVLNVTAEKANAIDLGDKVLLRGPDDEPCGFIEVDEIYRYNPETACEGIFGTDDRSHPGVEMFHGKDPFFVGGDVGMLHEVDEEKRRHDLTPAETRVLFAQNGWDSVAGFQTRNVPHRAHEYLQKSTLEHVDALFVQPKIGEKKDGDYTNGAILEGYERLIEEYYPADIVVLSTFKSRMWYAGPVQIWKTT